MLWGWPVVLAAAACGDRALEKCTAAYEAGSYEEAVQLCEEAHSISGDPQAGATAARALVQLREGDRALAWVERLKGTSAEPGLWSVAALVYFDRGEPERAVEAYRHDLELLRQAGDHRRLASTHYGLFYVAWERSRYREALEQARLSFQEAGTAGDPKQQARAAEALSTVLTALGDLAGARRALDQAGRLLPPESTFERASLLGNQGVLALNEGQPELARHHLEKAMELTRGRVDRQLLRSQQLNLAQAHLDRGDLASAERYLTAAREHYEPGEAPIVSLLSLQARVAREQGHLDEAARLLAEALATDPVPDWAWELEHESGRVAEERGDERAAERAYQRSTAILEDMRRTLGFDELKAWLLERKRQPFESLFLLQIRAGRPAEALATVERAKARTFQDALVHATSSMPATGWAAAAARADALRDLQPAMSESPVAALLPVDRILAASKNRRSLVYFQAREELWLLDVSGGQVRPRRLAASLGQVRELADRSLAAPDDRAAAEALGSLLLPPDLALPAGSALYIIPDGVLARLPFAALRRQGRWLVEDLAVVYAPGLSALAAPADRRAAGPPVVLADPRGDLAEAAAEGREVARLLGTEPRLGPAANRRALEAAAGAPVLHIAGHAGWGPGGPWLELADGQVAPAAILAARVRPRLVVLASCASAFPSGRGLWGSPGAAFLAAGSGSVLATLGSVEDRNARDLIRHFYREGGATDPAHGLARAQRVLLAAGRPPSAWAPFVLLGADSF
jgi:CHAT domain-containing protein/Tfp pilus assembly protein PilF